MPSPCGLRGVAFDATGESVVVHENCVKLEPRAKLQTATQLVPEERPHIRRLERGEAFPTACCLHEFNKSCCRTVELANPGEMVPERALFDNLRDDTVVGLATCWGMVPESAGFPFNRSASTARLDSCGGTVPERARFDSV